MKKRKYLKSNNGAWWGVTNCGMLLPEIFVTRRDAMEWLEDHAEENGIAKWRDYYEIRKLRVEEWK